MKDITFLRTSQLSGINRLSIFDKYGKKSAVTDFCNLMGAFTEISHTLEGVNYKSGCYYTKTDDDGGDVLIVNCNGDISWELVNSKNVCGRVLINNFSKYASIDKDNISDISEVNYGEYPQWVVHDLVANVLEKFYQNNELVKTGKRYDLNSDVDDRCDNRTFEEYYLNGRKYVRVVVDEKSEIKRLLNGKLVNSNDVVWIEVLSITWYYDKVNDLAVCKYLLFSGIPFDIFSEYKEENFTSVNIKKYVDNKFFKDIVPSDFKLEEKKDLDDDIDYVLCNEYLDCIKELEIGDDNTIFAPIDEVTPKFFKHTHFGLSKLLAFAFDLLNNSDCNKGYLFISFDDFTKYVDNALKILTDMNYVSGDRLVKNEFNIEIYENPKNYSVVDLKELLPIDNETLKMNYFPFGIEAVENGFIFKKINYNSDLEKNLTLREYDAFYGEKARKILGINKKGYVKVR